MLLKSALVATLLGLTLFVSLIFLGGQRPMTCGLCPIPYDVVVTPYPTRDP